MNTEIMQTQKKSFVTRLALVCALILATISAAQAATFTVNVDSDLHDTNPGDGICHAAYRTCTLRAAIEEANALLGADTIAFSPSFKAPNPPKTVVLTLGTLYIKSELTINGTGARQLMIDGDHKTRVFDVAQSAPGVLTIVGIHNLTVQNGYNYAPFISFAAGITNHANLLLTGVIIRNNHAFHENDPQQGEYGGGIRNYNFLNLVGSLVTGNKAGMGGGVYNSGVFYAYNSTISNNHSYWRGGGIHFDGFSNETSYLRNVTVANNYAQTQPGGGISIEVNAVLQMANSIVGNNFGQSDNDLHGTFISGGNNLVKNRGASAGYIASDLPNGTDPTLAPLNNYGGSTDTHALLPGSPAIDAGNNCVIVPTNGCTGEFYYDQRGLGFPRKMGRSVDIGAFEFQGGNSTTAQISGIVLKPNGRGLNNAFVTLMSTDGEPQMVETDQHGNFTFEEVAPGRSYTIAVQSRQHNYQSQSIYVVDSRDDLVFTPGESR